MCEIDINNKSGSNPHELEYHKLQLTSYPRNFPLVNLKGTAEQTFIFWISLIPDRTRRRTAKPLFERRTLWLKELSSLIMHGKCVRLVLLKTYWQADWLSQKFFKVCLNTNNTDGKCLKCNLFYNSVVTRVQSHFCNNKIVAHCNTTCRTL